jgi:hypothetical protein
MKRISRKLIDRFIFQKKLSTIEAFFKYVSRPANLKTFAAYAKIKMPEQTITRVLFHGSQTYHEELIPTRKEKFVYATDNPTYAIFLGVLDLNNASAGVSITKKETKLTVDLDFVNGRSSLRPGWVYIIDGDNFKQAANSEYISKRATKVLCAIPVQPSDLTIPIVIKVK